MKRYRRLDAAQKAAKLRAQFAAPPASDVGLFMAMNLLLRAYATGVSHDVAAITGWSRRNAQRARTWLSNEAVYLPGRIREGARHSLYAGTAGVARDGNALAGWARETRRQARAWWSEEVVHIPARTREGYLNSAFHAALVRLDGRADDGFQKAFATLAPWFAPVARWLDRRVPSLNQALYRAELAVRHRVAQSRVRESALAGLTTGRNAIGTWLANARRSRPHADDLKAGGAAFSGWVATNGAHAQSGFNKVTATGKAFTDRVAATGNGLRQRFAASSNPWTDVYDEPPRVDPVEEIYRLNLYQPRKRSRIKVTRRRSARIKRLAMAATVLGTGVLALGVVSGAIMYASIESDFVPLDRMAVNQPASGAVVLDRNGELLYRYVDEATGFREPVSLDDVSEHLLAVTIATEDANFYSNPGINARGLARAAWENFSPFSGGILQGSGGSSITQQLVKRVYFDQDEQASRSVDRKAREVIFALKLNSRYEKEQILAWYLNEISYGGVFYGIEAASRGYFDKPASELTLAEAALLAGIPQAPAVYDPRANPEAARDRRNQVLDLLAEHATLQVREGVTYTVDLAAIEAAKRAPLELPPPEPQVLNAPHFVLTYLQPELEARFGSQALMKDGLTITTTIDLKLQREAERILEEHIATFEEDSNTRNGAAVVIDPRTGELLAMVGSRDYARTDIEGQNNNLLVLNSPGSAFKPFVYLGLFLKDGSGPARPIDDSPLKFPQPDGSVFEPENPDDRNRGWVTVRNALGNSLNVTAFRAAEEVSVPQVVSLGKRAGLTTLDGSYGPAIAIGGVDVKPLDLAFAYTTLANGGVMRGQPAVIPHGPDERQIDPVSILAVTDANGTLLHEASAHAVEEQVFPEQHVFMINDILTDPQAQCWIFGCGGLKVPGHEVAVKTGTSEPFDPEGPDAGKIGETWAFGYTPEVVVGIWAGNADNAPITNITSTSIAFRSMRDLVTAYYGDAPSSKFEAPPGVVKRRACFTKPTRMCSNDWFLEESLQALTTGPEIEPERRPAESAWQALERLLTEREPQSRDRDDDDDDDRRPASNRGRGNSGRR